MHNPIPEPVVADPIEPAVLDISFEQLCEVLARIAQRQARQLPVRAFKPDHRPAKRMSNAPKVRRAKRP